MLGQVESIPAWPQAPPSCPSRPSCPCSPRRASGIMCCAMSFIRHAEPRNGDRKTFDCDVIVVGGGPSGSVAAAWLARAGRRVILVERDQFPRFHIGESLLASVNDVFGAIGADDLIRQAGFPQKWGATFLSADGLIER